MYLNQRRLNIYFFHILHAHEWQNALNYAWMSKMTTFYFDASILTSSCLIWIEGFGLFVYS